MNGRFNLTLIADMQLDVSELTALLGGSSPPVITQQGIRAMVQAGGAGGTVFAVVPLAMWRASLNANRTATLPKLQALFTQFAVRVVVAAELPAGVGYVVQANSDESVTIVGQFSP